MTKRVNFINPVYTLLLQKTKFSEQLNGKKQKMKTRNVMVSLAAFAILAIALMGTVSAGEIANSYSVEVNNVDAYTNSVSVIAGDTVRVEVYFTSLVDDTDVTVEAEIEGQKVKFSEISAPFDIEAGNTYRKVLSVEVPYELKDEVSDIVELNIVIDGKDHKTDLDTIELTVQRPSYNAVIKSVTTPTTVEAGKNFDVSFVLKNMGYNDLDDVYVEASIPELGVNQGPVWVGDLVNIGDCTSDCDNEDTVSGTLSLEVPFGIDEGIYTLELTVYNDDTESTKVKQIVVKNDFANEVIATNTERDVAIGQDAKFTLLLVNPTDNVRVYTIAVDSDDSTSASADKTTVAVSAGSSTTVTISAEAKKEGTNTFTVNVLSNGNLVDSVEYTLNAKGRAASSTVVLAIILAIIFVVLLVVLIVLLARKPEKTEEFGESYY
ncbi:hypothetical protein B6U91_00135 [Candidatus Pacearchaeota archaeon ex4484_71]|nr:MAG: hypothetical protein B6U91_00135 [Candidatus Pacearchaeota archaeon ex4484_71]